MDYPGTSKYLDPLRKFVPTIDQQHEGIAKANQCMS